MTMITSTHWTSEAARNEFYRLKQEHADIMRKTHDSLQPIRDRMAHICAMHMTVKVYIDPETPK